MTDHRAWEQRARDKLTAYLAADPFIPDDYAVACRRLMSLTDEDMLALALAAPDTVDVRDAASDKADAQALRDGIGRPRGPSAIDVSIANAEFQVAALLQIAGDRAFGDNDRVALELAVRVVFRALHALLNPRLTSADFELLVTPFATALGVWS